MKKIMKQMAGQKIWLVFLLLTDLLAGFLLWLADVKSFFILLGLLILGTLLLFAAGTVQVFLSEKKRRDRFLQFLQNPDPDIEKQMTEKMNGADRELMLAFADVLNSQRELSRTQAEQLKDYEEYVETWAHEMKTPLSLFTFLLDNRRDEIPENLYHRLEYVRCRAQESVNQMLFFSRLKGSTKDYQFEKLTLWECFREALEDYQMILAENDFLIQGEGKEITALSDRRGLVFMFGQAISNSVKYRREQVRPEIHFWAGNCPDENCVEVVLRDNGRGAASYDLPFVFEKGFTGDAGMVQKKATGMGLYLMSQMAKDLKVTVEAKSEAGQWFELIFRFPVV